MACNVGGIDRFLRAVVGLGLIALVLVGPQTAWGWIGLFPLATAVLGWCRPTLARHQHLPRTVARDQERSMTRLFLLPGDLIRDAPACRHGASIARSEELLQHPHLRCGRHRRGAQDRASVPDADKLAIARSQRGPHAQSNRQGLVPLCGGRHNRPSSDPDFPAHGHLAGRILVLCHGRRPCGRPVRRRREATSSILPRTCGAPRTGGRWPWSAASRSVPSSPCACRGARRRAISPVWARATGPRRSRPARRSLF